MTLEELRAERARIDELILLEEIRTAPWPWPHSGSPDFVGRLVWAREVAREFERRSAFSDLMKAYGG